jgi:glutamate-ammonia-ligase adenylyltransferase
MTIYSQHFFEEILTAKDGRLSRKLARQLEPFGDEHVEDIVRLIHRLAQQPNTKTWLFPLLPSVFFEAEKTANPYHALLNFERLVENFPLPQKLSEIVGQPRVLEMLLVLFAGSQFLTDILLRNPLQIIALTDLRTLTQQRSVESYIAEGLKQLNNAVEFEQQMNVLRNFQQQQLLKIGFGDLLNILDLRTVIRQLSNLADAIVQLAVEICQRQVSAVAEGFAVLAMGKLGGRELNYSSDIDLIFVAETQNEALQQFGSKVIDFLNRPTTAGFLYRVDMRLRPWGSAGALVPDIDAYLQYLKNNADNWEKQALLKVRFIAGNETVGWRFIREIRPLIFAEKDAVDAGHVQSEVYRMKNTIEKKLRRKGIKFGEVKSGEGSLRDVEFTTQYLQLVYGASHPEILSRNTLDALARMVAEKILPLRNYRILSEGYVFLRSIEHYLQIMHNRQTHQLPENPRELQILARRLGFEGHNSGEQLVKRYRQHKHAIREVYRRYLDAGYAEQVSRSLTNDAAASVDHTKIRLNNYLSEYELAECQAIFSQLDPDNPVMILPKQIAENCWQLIVIGYDYPGAFSIICGLLFVQGFNILEGHIFTIPAEKSENDKAKSHRRLSISQLERLRRSGAKIPGERVLDLLVVERLNIVKDTEWQQYQSRLVEFWRMLQQKQIAEARGKMAQLFADALPAASATNTMLLVDIEIDNSASDEFTVLRIDAPDTKGFLYELTNALALNDINLAQMTVFSLGNRAHDTLYITDVRGQKITDAVQLHRLKAATVLIKHFSLLLPYSPNPAAAMTHFHKLASQIFNQPDEQLNRATLERPEVLSALAKLLGVSDFLWEDFLRIQHANLFPLFQNLEILRRRISRKQLVKMLERELAESSTYESKRNILNAFKDREMFRIDMRYIQGVNKSFVQFSKEITELAEVVVTRAWELALQEITEQYGSPQTAQGQCAAAMFALGKFGGEEMGFASDVELMIIFAENGATSGKKSISNIEFYEKAIATLNQNIHSKKEGLFELDLRLRPYGKAGNIAVVKKSFEEYFHPEGAAWQFERQALVRMRPIWGDTKLINEIILLRDQYVFAPGKFDVAAMRALREKQIRQLVEGGTINAKFSPGALVDLEYTIQGLQMKYAGQFPALRQTNTRKAISQMVRHGILSAHQATQFKKAHLLIRRVIEALRMVRGNAKDLTIPQEESSEFLFLARRLGFRKNPHLLYEQLYHHTQVVQQLSHELLGDSLID